MVGWEGTGQILGRWVPAGGLSGGHLSVGDWMVVGAGGGGREGAGL